MQRSSQNFSQVDIRNEDAWLNMINQYYLSKSDSGASVNIVQAANNTSSSYGMRMSISNASTGKDYGFWFAGDELDTAAGGATQVQRVLVKTAAGDRYLYLYSD